MKCIQCISSILMFCKEFCAAAEVWGKASAKLWHGRTRQCQCYHFTSDESKQLSFGCWGRKPLYLLTCHVELDVPGDEGGRGDLVPGAAGEHLGQVALGRPHPQHRHRAPVTMPEHEILYPQSWIFVRFINATILYSIDPNSVLFFWILNRKSFKKLFPNC